MMRRSILVIAPLFALAACGDSDPAPETSTGQGGEAEGDLLGGSISDDMIPLDQLTSQSPPAERAANSEGSSASAPDTEPAPQPAAETEEAEAAPATAAPAVAPPLSE